MTGARSPLREQNPAYRACTLPRASFRMARAPFFNRTHRPSRNLPPGQSPLPESSSQRNPPLRPSSRRTTSAGTIARHLRKVSRYTTFIKTAHFNIVSTRFQSYFDMKYKKPRISPIRRQKNFQRGFSCPNTSPYIYIKTGNI